jgi:hypothetical protein
MSVFYMPVPSAYGQNVQPPDGAKLYFFEPGTTTPKTTYKEQSESTPHTHPVVADSTGRFDAIFLTGTYKVVLKDKNDVTIWTEDNVTGAGNSWADQGDFDSSTNAGDYPAGGNKNDVYRVTEEFVLNAASGGHRVYVGDFIKSNVSSPTATNADWDIIKGISINTGAVALTVAATTPTDCRKGTIFTATLDQNTTLSNPSNKIIGQTYTWIITQDSTGDRTLAYGTDFDFLTNSTIESTAAAKTTIVGRCVSATSIECWIENPVDVDYETDRLLINVASTASVTATADRIKFISKKGHTITVNDMSVSFALTDIMSGTSLKASTWYDLWTDSTGGVLMTPRINSVTDGTTSNKLVDSFADFVTDKVSIGDIVYNDTDKTQATVTAVDDLNTLSLSADIFTSGESYYIEYTDPPSGLGIYRANIGIVKLTAGSVYDTTTGAGYRQPQKTEWFLSGNYSITGTPTVNSHSGKIGIYPTLDWKRFPEWRATINVETAVSSASRTSGAITIGGLTFAATYVQGGYGHGNFGTVVANDCNTTANSGTLTVRHASSTTTAYRYGGNFRLQNEPTFYARH